MTFCHLQLVTDFNTPPGVAQPDARWHVDLDRPVLTFERRPSVEDPFTPLGSSGRLFLMAGESRPIALWHQGRNFYLDPPGGLDDCLYWQSHGTGQSCPSAPVCPYRAHLVRFRPAPLEAGRRTELHVVERPLGASEPPPAWNLFPPHVPATGRLCDRPALDDKGGLASLPPVTVPDQDSFFGPFASRLRQVLIGRPMDVDRLRSDLLVLAIDLPGVREVAAAGLLDALDLDEKFPPLVPGDDAAPLTRALVVCLASEPEPNHPVAAWREVYGFLRAEHQADVARQWLRGRVATRLNGHFRHARWQTGEVTVRGMNPSIRDRSTTRPRHQAGTWAKPSRQCGGRWPDSRTSPGCSAGSRIWSNVAGMAGPAANTSRRDCLP
jgi:hypothetical protein